MARLRRTILSLLFVTLAYGVYALCLVPFVEPATEADPLADAAQPLASSTVTDPFVRELSPIFPEGSWELDHPRVLRSEQVTFLLKEFEELDDGRLHVRPCTVVHYGRKRDQGPIGTTIMQAPQGAILEFDKPVGLSSGDFSAKPVAGQLVGPIRIVRLSKDRDEDLELVTSNVRITEKQIWTGDRVRFQLGNTQGEGSNLLITRAASSPTNDAGETLLDDLGTIELQQIHELSFLTEQGDLFGSFSPAQTQPTQPAAQNALPSRITIRCQGPMIVDLNRMKATLEDQVVVSRQQQGQHADTLAATHLWMDFARNQPAPAKDGAATTEQPELQITRIVAEGDPLVIDARSMHGYLESQRLEYSFQTRDLKLFGSNPFATRKTASDGQVRLRTPEYQMAAPSIEFHNDEDRTLWEIHAEGQGFFGGSLDGETPVQVRWQKGLHMVPRQGQQVLFVQGNATAQTPQSGSISADEIELWMLPVTEQIGTRLDGTPVMKSSAKPTRLVTRSVTGNQTQIESPQLRGTLQGIQILFEPDPNRIAQATPTALSRFQPGGFGANSQNELTGNKTPEQKFKITGGQLTAWIDPQSQDVHRMLLQGHSKIVEETKTPTGSDSERPLQLEGDSIAVSIVGGAPIAELTGSPARIGAPDLDVVGNKIEFNAQRNVIHIPGSGSMTVMVANDFFQKSAAANGFTGQPTQPQNAWPAANVPPRVLKPVEVTWQEGLHFDGRVASVSGNIQAVGDDLSFASHEVKITLDRSIDFSQRDAGEVQPELQFISARGGIMFAVQSRDARNQPQSFQRMVANNLDMDFTTGDINAQGPGRLSFTSADKLLPSMNSRQPADPPPSNNTLTHMAIAFNTQLQGNMNRREVHLYDNIRMWMGPVNDWSASVDPNERGTLGKDDVWMSCNELFVLESPTAAPVQERKPIELLARGEAYVEGQLFAAKGHEIKYAEEKDMLTFEGDATSPAELWQRNSPNERGTSQGRVKRIRYWPKSTKAVIEGFRGFDVSAAPKKSQTQ